MRVGITEYPVVYQVLMCFWVASQTPLMGSICIFSTNRQNFCLEFCWCCSTEVGLFLNVTSQAPLCLFNQVTSQWRSTGPKFWKNCIGEESKIKDILIFFFWTFGAVWTWSSKSAAETPSSRNTRSYSLGDEWRPLSSKPPKFDKTKWAWTFTFMLRSVGLPVKLRFNICF